MSDENVSAYEEVGTYVAAVVLAAGSSQRFGEDNKLLATIDGTPLIRRVVDAIAKSDVHQIIVVTGHDADDVSTALAGAKVTFVHNAQHAEGISGSIRTGIERVEGEMQGALICLADMPETEPLLINRLIDRFASSGHQDIVCPTLPDGERRNPVLWPRRFFAELKALSGDAGAKQLIAEHEADVRDVRVATAKVFMDIDTPEALAEYAPQPNEDKND